MSKHHVVALGSSFAAGPGIPEIVDKKALRSSNNYAHSLAKRLNARLTDLSSSGATLSNVLDTPQKHVFASPSLPQLAYFPTDATMVTITAGGNDLGYLPGLILDGVLSTIRSIPIVNYFVTARISDKKAVVGVGEVVERFVRIIDRVKELSPAAEIYLVDYLTILGPDAVYGPKNPLTKEQIFHHQHVAEELSRAYETAVDLRPETKLVRMEQSREHGVGSAQPWVDGYSMWMIMNGGAPYHPNQKGHEAIADELCERITGSKG